MLCSPLYEFCVNNSLKDVETMLRAIRVLRRCCCRRDDDEDGHELRVKKDYEIGEVIGRGRLGVVHKCIHRTTGQEFACKEMPANDNALNELLILRSRLPGGHPGILRPITFYRQERVGKYSWTKNIYIISELCDGGDLQHLIGHGHGVLSERLTARIIQSLVQSLQYCHAWKIIHRDVKPSSIFITSANSVNTLSWGFKLGNFDVAIWKGYEYVVDDNVGALGYSAPEMLSGNGYSYEVDIWSAGVVLYVLLCGRTPFYAEEEARLMLEQIQNTELNLSSWLWRSVSDSAKELVLGMMQKDRTRRLSCDQILSHPWILRNAPMDVASSAAINTEIVSTSGDGAGHP